MDLFVGRLRRHTGYLVSRMIELQNGIMVDFLAQENPDWRAMKHKRTLLKKYQRRLKLINK